MIVPISSFLPAPNISTLSDIEIPALLQACTPTDNGSSNAPSSNETWSGNLKIDCILNNCIYWPSCQQRFQDRHVSSMAELTIKKLQQRLLLFMLSDQCYTHTKTSQLICTAIELARYGLKNNNTNNKRCYTMSLMLVRA